MKEVDVKLNFPIGKLGKRAMLKVAKAIIDDKALAYIDRHDRESVNFLVTDSEGRQETFCLFRYQYYFSNVDQLHFTCNVELDRKCTGNTLIFERENYFKFHFKNNIDWKYPSFEKETFPA